MQLSEGVGGTPCLEKSYNNDRGKRHAPLKDMAALRPFETCKYFVYGVHLCMPGGLHKHMESRNRFVEY